MSTENRTVIWTTRIAVTAATLVILSAGILGYTALYDLFVSIGLFAAWLGIFFPLLFDLAEVAAAVSVFNAKLQGEEDKFAWGMVIFFTALGIVANIGHATAAWWTGRIDTVQVILAIFATSLFPLSVALVTHLVKRVIARTIERAAAVQTLAELGAQADRLRTELTETLSHRQGELDRLTGQIDQATAKLEQIKSDLKATHFQQKSTSIAEMNAARQAQIDQRREQVLVLANEGKSAPAIAAELGVSVSTVKRDLAALNGSIKAGHNEPSDHPNGSALNRIANAALEGGKPGIADILTTTKRGWNRVNGVTQ